MDRIQRIGVVSQARGALVDRLPLARQRRHATDR